MGRDGGLPIVKPGFGHKAILGFLKMIDENVLNELAERNTGRLCFRQQPGFDLLRYVDRHSHMPVFSQIRMNAAVTGLSEILLARLAQIRARE